MKLNQNAKSMIAIMALVGAIILALNAVVAPNSGRDMISWSIGMLALAILFWIWIRRESPAERRADPAAAAEDAAAEAEALAKRREVRQEEESSVVEVLGAKTGASGGESDDFTVLWGIGEDYQSVLYSADIRTYAQLASLSSEELEDVFPGRLPSYYLSLPKQAEFAAKGDWEGLREYQDRF